MRMGWKSLGRLLQVWSNRKVCDGGQTDNGYRGVSQRLMATALGSVGWAYRDSLSSGTEYRCMNVGNLTIRPKQVNQGLDWLKLK